MTFSKYSCFNNSSILIDFLAYNSHCYPPKILWWKLGCVLYVRKQICKARGSLHAVSGQSIVSVYSQIWHVASEPAHGPTPSCGPGLSEQRWTQHAAPEPVHKVRSGTWPWSRHIAPDSAHRIWPCTPSQTCHSRGATAPDMKHCIDPELQPQTYGTGSSQAVVLDLLCQISPRLWP